MTDSTIPPNPNITGSPSNSNIKERQSLPIAKSLEEGLQVTIIQPATNEPADTQTLIHQAPKNDFDAFAATGVYTPFR